MEIFTWLSENWVSLVAIMGGVVIAARLLLMVAAGIAKLTTSPRDDEIISNWQKIFDGVVVVLKGLALNVPTMFQKGAGNGKTLLLLLIPLIILAAGCQAPANVREAQAWEGRILAMHLNNDQRINGAWESLLDNMRDPEIARIDQEAIDYVKGQMTAGKLTPADLDIAIKTIMEQHKKAVEGTEMIKKQMRSLLAANKAELEKAARLHGGLTEWMETGMDETAIPGLVSEVGGLTTGIINPAKKVP